MGWIGPPGAMSHATAGGPVVDGREDAPSVPGLSRCAVEGLAVSGAKRPAGMLGSPRLPEDRASVDDLNRLVSQSIGAIAIVLGFAVIVLLAAGVVLARRVPRAPARLPPPTPGGGGSGPETSFPGPVASGSPPARTGGGA